MKNAAQIYQQLYYHLSTFMHLLLNLKLYYCEDLLPLRILKILNFPENLKW